MAVLFVIPLEKLLAEGAAVLDAAEAIWELRAVLREFPVSLRKKLGWPISRRNIPQFTAFRRQACFDAVATALTVG